jgi:hypothetical protein
MSPETGTGAAVPGPATPGADAAAQTTAATTAAAEQRADDVRRRDALARLGLLGTGAEERFDRITRLASQEFGVDLALINLVGDEALHAKSQPVGVDFGRTPFGTAFCEHTVRQPGMLEITDAAADARWSSLPAVTEHGMRFYAGVPLRVQTGEAVATLCLYGQEPRTLDDGERDLLSRLGLWAQAELRTDEATADEREAAEAAADAVGATAEAASETGPDVDTADAAAPRGQARVSTLAIPFGAVSGDASAWSQTEDRLVVSLVDVMGKGEAAGAIARAVVDDLQSHGPVDPAEALRRAEESVGARLRDSDSFTTVFHGVLDLTTGELRYVDAGHGLTMHLGADGRGTRLFSRNLPLGLISDGDEWEVGRVEIDRGDVLVSVSDGALDAYDSTLDSLRRLGDELRASCDPGAFFDALAVRVADQLVDDDVTAVVVAVS